MATTALPVECAAEGVSEMCGRNASMPSWVLRAVDVRCQGLARREYGLAGHSADWSIRDVRTGALLQLQQFPHNTPPTSFRGLCPSPLAFCVLFRVCLSPPAMSSQQCLRRLPSAMRSSALRAGARSVARAPAARSYSAISKATSSGLLSQVSRYVAPLSALEPLLSPC